MHSSAVENYLKHLFLEQRGDGEELVAMGRLASAVGAGALVVAAAVTLRPRR